MAAGWLTALKIIPWNEVLEAAPQLVKNAKRLFRSAKPDDVESPAASEAPDVPPTLANLAERVLQLRNQLEQRAIEQQAQAALTESLAEQNTRLVAAIDVLRMRIKILGIVGAFMLVGLVLLAILTAPLWTH